MSDTERPVAWSARGIQYEEIRSRSALNRVRGMSFDWSLNPYQGCVHGCHYCYARRYHGFLELDAGEDFPRIIFVKVNLPQLLRRELRRPSWVNDTVAVGTATDPYQPIEGRYRLTRRCLEAFVDHGNPISLVTKGTLIVRDLDLLSSLASGPGCTVVFSLTTMDRELWQRLEPGTPPPEQRLRAMQRLVRSGVRAGVLLAPVIPGITDDSAGMEAVVRAAADHGAHFLGTRILYLQPGTREHFLDFLQQQYPQLLSEYRRLFPGPYLPKRFRQQVMDRVEDLKRLHAMRDRPAPPARVLRQMGLEI